MILDLLPGIRRMQYLTFSLRSESLDKNLAVIERGNNFLQQGNSKMAVVTVLEYITKEKEVALKTLENGLDMITSGLKNDYGDKAMTWPPFTTEGR